MKKQNELTNYSSQMYVHGSLLETTIWQIISACKLESCNCKLFWQNNKETRK
jgi:hypothetical protein